MANLQTCYDAGWEISFIPGLGKWLGVKDKGTEEEFQIIGDHQSEVFKEICAREKWPEPGPDGFSKN